MTPATPAAATTRPPASAGAGHVAALDGVRGLAVALVLAFHFGTVGIAPIRVVTAADAVDLSVFRLFSLGWIGVDLFFALSGFLITGLLLDDVGRPGYYRRFYTRRALRIFPLYYGALAALYVLAPFVGSPPIALQTRELLGGTPWAWAYGLNVLEAVHPNVVPAALAHFWSLAVEEHFYLVWPAVIALVRAPRRVALIALAAAVASWGLRLWLRFGAETDPAALYVLTPTRLEGLAIGAWIAAALRDPATAGLLRAWGARSAAAPLAAWGLGAALLAALLAVLGRDGFALGIQAVGLPVLAVAFGVVVLAAAVGGGGPASSRPGPVVRLCSGRALRLLGRYSYGLYVWHLPIGAALLVAGVTPARLPQMDLWGLRLPTHLAWAVLAAALTGAVTAVSWVAWERPWLALKRFVPYALAPTPSSTPSAAPDAAPIPSPITPAPASLRTLSDVRAS
jgi:peptidoglycan/LPS O-acetylase OafA/YrhL